MSAQFDPALVIDRANRLMGLRTHPGFADLFRISQEIVALLTATTIDYPGWDVQQLMVLKSRAQAAKEHHDLLFGKMNDAIRDGVQAQAAATNLNEKSPREILEQGDLVRQEVLTKFEQMDGQESRLPGSY